VVLPLATLAAVAVSAALAITALNARSSPLSSTQRAEFVTACATNATVSRCQCLLTQLQAAGYETPDHLRGVLESEAAAVAAGRPQAGPPAFVLAVRFCRS
jgi:hypothetical protein